MRLAGLATLNLVTLNLATLILGLWAQVALGFEVEEHVVYTAPEERVVLRVISTADRRAFEPILLGFQAENPGITVDYTITSTTDLMRAIAEEGAQFDLAISSAMDLQTKLANDGFALTYADADTVGLPDWASWRDQIFAFTQEPAVLVVSDAYFPSGTPVPRNRDELISLLRDNADRFMGRVGTYDVRSSGFGYLMATQDSRNSEAFWRLMEVMGRLDARLYCCSGDMIRDVASGELALAYNVLGSYARSQQEAVPGFRIVEMEDYLSVMLRTALIPANAQEPEAARMLVDFLLQLRQRPDLVAASGLPSIEAGVQQANTALRPIRFGPGLLVFLDQLRRENFLRSWENSLVQQ